MSWSLGAAGGSRSSLSVIHSTGITGEHTLAELQALDVGYGYTAGGGKTFPFRGQGVGKMPSLAQVLDAFPDKDFLVNVKSNDPAEGQKLAVWLSRLSPQRRDHLMAYGGDEPIAELHRRLPDLRTLSRASVGNCVLRYAGHGWTGIVPDACRQALILIPLNVAPWLWGWPNIFLDRMHAVGSRVFVQGDFHRRAVVHRYRYAGGLRTPAQRLFRRHLDR
jgi:glycerophosphoryl diester phosphodiesterase